MTVKTKTSNIHVAVDGDGVILDFLKAFEMSSLDVIGRSISLISGSYDLAERYGLTHKEKSIIWSNFHEKGLWKDIPLINGSDIAIKKLQLAGFQVHVVTAIDEDLRDSRATNLAMYSIDNFIMHCTGHTKAAKLVELAPIIFFDDNPLHHTEAKEAGVVNRILINDRVKLPCADCTGEFTSLLEATDWFLANFEVKQTTLRSPRL